MGNSLCPPPAADAGPQTTESRSGEMRRPLSLAAQRGGSAKRRQAVLGRRRSSGSMCRRRSFFTRAAHCGSCEQIRITHHPVKTTRTPGIMSVFEFTIQIYVYIALHCIACAHMILCMCTLLLCMNAYIFCDISTRCVCLPCCCQRLGDCD
jgi:hypothetical protein